MKKAITTIVAAMALALGGLAAAGFASPPPSNPGSPGDNCSHGNSNQPCKEDPSPNGKDCEDHGKARGNEDHCDGTTTTTPTETTPTETTPTTPTETTPTTPEETVPCSDCPQPTVPEPTTPTETVPPQETVPVEGSSDTPPVVKTTELEKQLDKQAKANGAESAPVATAVHPADELPYTGLPLGAWVALGLGLVGSGLALRRRAR